MKFIPCPNDIRSLIKAINRTEIIVWEHGKEIASIVLRNGWFCAGGIHSKFIGLFGIYQINQGKTNECIDTDGGRYEIHTMPKKAGQRFLDSRR